MQGGSDCSNIEVSMFGRYDNVQVTNKSYV